MTRSDIIADIIEVFEDFLDERNIPVPNEEKDEAVADGEDPASICTIYGSDYGNLSDRIESILVSIGAIQEDG